MDHPTLTATAADRDGSAAVAALHDLLAPGRVVVLSGAGISTESGIPDYRGPTWRVARCSSVRDHFSFPRAYGRTEWRWPLKSSQHVEPHRHRIGASSATTGMHRVDLVEQSVD